jgi:phage FluMu protein gp41
MKTIVDLTDGLTIGDKQHTRVELKEYSAGDLMDACDAAEKMVYTEAGPVLVASPTRMDMELLCRQIVKIGEHDGPLSIMEIRKLSGGDLAKLQIAAALLDAGASKASTMRGRPDGSQGPD